MNFPLEFESLLLNSASVARLVYDEGSEELIWSGWTEPILPYWNDTLPTGLDSFCSRIKPASAARFKSFLLEGLPQESFALDFRNQRPGSTHFFIITFCPKKSNRECYFHILDRAFDRIDSQSRDQSKALIDRTEEGHHRAKNILQSIISYLNILVSGRDSLAKSEVDRVIRYVHVLASIHDVLHDQLMERNRLDVVRLDRVIQTLLSRYALGHNVAWNEIPAIVVRSARAASLSLLINEIVELICLNIDLSTAIFVNVEMVSVDRVKMEISRSYRTEELSVQDLELSSNMRIIQLLTKADRQISFDLSVRDQSLNAVFELQVNPENKI